jgi:hypothetical protein
MCIELHRRRCSLALAAIVFVLALAPVAAPAATPTSSTVTNAICRPSADEIRCGPVATTSGPPTAVTPGVGAVPLLLLLILVIVLSAVPPSSGHWHTHWHG